MKGPAASESDGSPDVRGIGRLLRPSAEIYISQEFLYFLMFGGLAALTNLVVGALLYGTPAIMPYWVAVFTGAASGLVVNFGLNYKFNFRFRGRSMAAQFRTFCLVSVFGIILTTALALLLRGIFIAIAVDAALTRANLPVTTEFLAHFCSVGLVTFYSFAAHKFLTFNIGVRNRLRNMVHVLSSSENG